jgi:hypothetical protein
MRYVEVTTPKLLASRCGSRDAELDVSRLPDNVTFGDLQPRMLCTVCDHRGADVSPSWLHHG